MVLQFGDIIEKFLETVRGENWNYVGIYSGHFVLLKDKIASDKRMGGRISNIKLI